MKTKASASFAMAALFSLVTFSAQTAAQTQTSSQPNSHVRYKLIDLGTLGGPNSTEGHQAPIVSNSGAVIGIAYPLARSGLPVRLLHRSRISVGKGCPH